jgi:hypothetical protein
LETNDPTFKISITMFTEFLYEIHGQNEGESNPVFALVFLVPNGGEKMGFISCTVYFGSV